MGPVKITHRSSALELQGFSSRATNKGATNVHEERVQRYVPYVHVHSQHLQDISDLINRDRRFYLRHVDETAKHAAIDDVMGDEDSDDDDDFHVFDVSKAEKESTGLDLGTVALQRIVTQMKGMRYDVQESVYVKDSAKLNGLKPYCDYVKGVPRVEEEDIFARMGPTKKR